ncbi:hypothetical protein ASC93_15175 [Massilia sp. Root335]|nr:hypothetical protein ASC93_15175 [Massilia sp. Root335]
MRLRLTLLLLCGLLSSLLCSFFLRLRAALSVRQTIFGATVAHQVTQIADAHASHFVHADQQRCADRQAVVTDLADHRRSDFQHARQRCIVLQLHFAEQNVQQVVGVVAFLG